MWSFQRFSRKLSLRGQESRKVALKMKQLKIEKGILIVVSAPSGCGKSTVVRALMEKRNNLRFSVSATTRKPRDGEVEGVDYYFVSREEFNRMVEADAFLEHAEYVGNCYGTPRDPVERQLSLGYDVYLDIDVQGAMQVKQLRPQTLMIFLMPPSMEELERRLILRGKNTPQEIRDRLAAAERECACRDEFDYTVVNDVVERAVAEISDLIDRKKYEINILNEVF